MSIVTISVVGSQLSVTAPYNSNFVRFAKRCTAKYQTGGEWWFDARDEARVREACLRYYGSDGHLVDVVTLRVTWPVEASTWHGPIAVFGRPVASATGRDSGARLGNGIVLLEGGFGGGGSRINWTTEAWAGTVVLVRDFPRAMAEQLILSEPDRYALEPEKPVIDREALEAERESLMRRLTEIDAMLLEAVS
jgi:hypothetical protein